MRNPAMEFTPAGSEPMMLAMPMLHALAGRPRVPLAALDDLPFVGFAPRTSSYFHALLRDLFKEAGVEPRVVQESVMPTILALVEAEVGVALVPASAAGLRTGRVVYRPVQGRGSAIRAVLHSVRRNDGLSPPADAFASILASIAGRRHARYASGVDSGRSAR